MPSTGFRIQPKVINGAQTSTVTAVVLSFRHGRTINELSALTFNRGWSSAMLRSVAAIAARRTAKA